MPHDERHRHFRLSERPEPRWFRWLLLGGIGLGLGLITAMIRQRLQ